MGRAATTACRLTTSTSRTGTAETTRKTPMLARPAAPSATINTSARRAFRFISLLQTASRLDSHRRTRRQRDRGKRSTTEQPRDRPKKEIAVCHGYRDLRGRKSWLSSGAVRIDRDRREHRGRRDSVVAGSLADVLCDAVLYVGLRIPWQDGNAGTLACGVADREEALHHECEIDDSHEHQQQDRQHDGQLDQLGAALRTDTTKKRVFHHNQKVSASPVAIGSA